MMREIDARSKSQGGPAASTAGSSVLLSCWSCTWTRSIGALTSDHGNGLGAVQHIYGALGGGLLRQQGALQCAHTGERARGGGASEKLPGRTAPAHMCPWRWTCGNAHVIDARPATLVPPPPPPRPVCPHLGHLFGVQEQHRRRQLGLGHHQRCRRERAQRLKAGHGGVCTHRHPRGAWMRGGRRRGVHLVLGFTTYVPAA